MSATSPAAPGRGGAAVGPGGTSWSVVVRRFFEWVLGIAGAIAIFLGVFVRFAGGDQSIGFFGLWSTRVEDVSDAWMFALLGGGSLLLGLAFALAAMGRSRGGVERTVAAWLFASLAVLGFAAGVVFGVFWALEL